MSAGSGRPVPARRRAVGQVLIAAYAVFAVAAGARSFAQVVTKLDEAPVAYLLSAVAAVVYLVATLAFRRAGRPAFRVALGACLFELVGVLGVGLWTYLDPDLFADATVWSHFGQGYGFVPLVLPFVGLAWLRHVEPETRPAR
ncbi:hypothetical protein [Nocardioides solisilvae]|uniref:hypothetical protein n=1 Tax=Nocardioides solisilvae TaxID=1542435 RepID=UPI000D74FD51|nr:hypothetical protein [Nocardioides solisilvae]